MIVRPTRRALLSGLIPFAGLATSAAVLGGCGFQPVYMPTATGRPGPAERELAAVQVGIIPDRPGQLLRQALQARFGNDSGAAAHRYDLVVSYWITGEGIAIQQDSTPTRIRVVANAAWVLVQQNPARTRLTQGSARAFEGINVFSQQYFALDLENEVVQQRLATTISEQIGTQLALWFRQRAAATATG